MYCQIISQRILIQLLKNLQSTTYLEKTNSHANDENVNVGLFQLPGACPHKLQSSHFSPRKRKRQVSYYTKILLKGETHCSWIYLEVPPWSIMSAKIIPHSSIAQKFTKYQSWPILKSIRIHKTYSLFFLQPSYEPVGKC